jgi:hypothetical protein
MIFNLDKYNVLYTKAPIFDKDPTTDKITTADLPQIKVMGVLDNESGYSIEPDQVVVNSLGHEVVATYKLSIDLNVQSVLTETQIEEIENNLLSIVLLPEKVKIPKEALDLSSSGITGFAGSKAIVFAPLQLKVKEAVKIGAGKINPLVLTGMFIETSKEKLKKEFEFNLT